MLLILVVEAGRWRRDEKCAFCMIMEDGDTAVCEKSFIPPRRVDDAMHTL